MPLADGQVFAGYTILGTLGTGGMGEVYLAEHPRLPRRDALKVLGANVSHDDEYRQRFNQEADMVATLQHPNIVTVYDRGDCDGQLWIAMAYVEGTDAFRLLTENYPDGIPAAEVARIIACVADALDYAHARGLLHRDIKPANILLGRGESDRVLLADFGVARWVGQPSDLTGVDVTVGTVTYAAPEQLKGEQIDGHADQYALAATTFHLLTGHPPFTHTNPAVVITQHLTATPPAIGTERPDLTALGPVFARALAKDPADRFDRCADFAEAMRNALSPSEGRSGQHRRVVAVPRSRRRAAAAVGAALLLGAAGTATAVLLKQRSGTAESSSSAALTTAPPPAVSARMGLPVVVLGADCAVLGAAAVTQSDSPAYCARDPYNVGETVWSLQPERFRNATSVPALPSANDPLVSPSPDSAEPPAADPATPPVP
ncbi:serine/threonine-protein kinase [Mycolicibacterium sp.]|uniref:serine/threonine-protein kinase n=1 Tax=Mycolicibacterium sp. TaxID=2320850 RepID=UPI0028AB9878|nr:serine/threonine-protein kinase [Mycolicibacterium sp.]